ncbi:MAG: tetratricopeptide repeat protein, partial [Anaerolineae bacterium]|nr:tetratricopeptide repeat protein [Anaerolineae bacterium]
MKQRILILVVVLAVTAAACVSPVNLSFLATQTPTPSATFTPAPTFTPTPTPTPEPTPLPAARLNLGENALLLGDYETARKQFQQISAEAQDDETRAAAEFGIGRALYLLRNYPTAITQLETALGNYPESSHASEAWFILAEAYNVQQQYLKAANAYAQYLALRPGLLEGYVQQWRGDALVNGGAYLEAVNSYQSAIDNLPSGDPVWLQIKQAQAYALAQDYSAATTLYLSTFQSTTNDLAKAQINLLLGQIYLYLEENEQAYARFGDSVINYPSSYDTYTGLVVLVQAGVPVNELNRGMVNYYAGQYGLCVEALTRYINNEQLSDATAYYFRALCRRESRLYDDALADFDIIINQYTGDAYWLKAYEQKAFTYWAYMDQFDAGAETLLAYVDLLPDAAGAPDELYEAGRIFERGNNLTRAAETWESMIERFPSAEASYSGLYMAGITRYRLQDYPASRTIFQRALVLAPEPGDQAASYLWIGKTHAAEGNLDLAQASWQQAVQRDPTGYYSERAAELLIGREPFTMLHPLDLGYDLNTERPDAEVWLRQRFSIPPETNLNDLSEISSLDAFQRAEELYHIGEYMLARDEYEKVRQQYLTDPVQTFRLMNHLLTRNMYRQAILSSRQILDLANLDDAGTLSAPIYFNHIRFGVYFHDVILETAGKE